MLDYYEKRLPEYEAIYHKPERQQDLGWLEQQLCDLTRRQRVIELACGTGYWTRRIAQGASALHATDGSGLLAQSAVASCPAGNVTWGVVDAFQPPQLQEYDVLVCGFFYSHVLKQQLDGFLHTLAGSARSGTRVVFFDNRFVAGSSTPISRTDDDGNTYQTRSLKDGSHHDVLKNFPDENELSGVLGAHFTDVSVSMSRYFWLAQAVVA